ncbi:hypothetical protein QN277_007576 [Acacia crassicarpa]|uniref:Uncharacterized protein n=1 Tax=Acacia crassicarpa TaxID=499986 RepID=A0AAE1IW69_9FABA|nr:hypothetical protein QN277_007576 [Acacia crassicarpa]
MGKSQGGMGFRDLVVMNDSLLAKSAWRLFTRPNNLWARVMKSVYFPNQEFIEAVKGHKASWCWSSLLAGRDILKDDLQWDVGTGQSIRIWGDNWVPGVSFPDKPPNCEEFIVEHGKVSDLISNGSWNLSPIAPFIAEDVKDAIYAIPISDNGLEDKLIWTHSSNGAYTVKAGYQVEKSKRSDRSSRAGPSCVISPQCWKSIWCIKVIPRVQNFLWRSLNRAVATNAALYSRRRGLTKLCPVCEEADETLEHLFFQCPWTRCVWFGCSLGVKFDCLRVVNFNSWWMRFLGMNSKFPQVISLLCWILWYIWKQRNEKVFNHVSPNPIVVIEQATRSNSEFWECIDRKQEVDASVMHDTRNDRWAPPIPGQLKINLDGAYVSGCPYGAIGVVCRDHFGTFKWGFIDKVKSISAFMTEALALKRALMLAVDLGHDNVIFETDCLLLLSCFNAKIPDLYDWRSRSILHDIIRLFSDRVGFSLSFIPRRGNRVADFLAAIAYKEVCPIGWVHQPSPSLSSLLTLDAQEANVVMGVSQASHPDWDPG